MKHWCLVVMIVLGAKVCPAQSDSLALSALIMPLEDAALAGELPDDLDWSDETGPWQRYLRNPLNLNAATLTEVAQLPGVGMARAYALLAHIAQTGPLLSVYELQAIPGFGPALVAQLRPFVFVPGDVAPGMNAQPLATGWTLSGLTSTGRTLQTARGYTENRFAGGPWSSFGRLRLREGTRTQAGLTWLQQAGEFWHWAPNNHWYGPDDLSAHLALNHRGALRTLIVGDYLTHWGQGLLLSTGPAWGRGANPALAAQRISHALRPSVGTNPALRLRGAAADIQLAPRWYLGLLTSLQGRDAGLSRDSLANLRSSTLHRTTSELRARQQATEQMLGARLRYQRNDLDLGLGYLTRRIAWAQPQPDSLTHWLQADWSWRHRNWSWFGEVVQQQRLEQPAWLSGLQAIVDPRLLVAVVARHFPAGMSNARAYALAQDPDGVRNERGVYVAFEYDPSRRWQVQGWLDAFGQPAASGRRSQPTIGTEWMLQTTYRPTRTTQMLLRLRQEQGERDLPADRQPGPLPTTTAWTRWRLRAEGAWQTAGATWHSRVELSTYQQEGLPSTSGWLLLQDVRLRPHPRLRVTGRLAWFAVTGFEARLYTVEPDLPGRWSVPAYQGQGWRLVGVAAWGLGPDWTLWLRMAHTRRTDIAQIGSGLDQLPGPSRTDIGLMLAWKWD